MSARPPLPPPLPSEHVNERDATDRRLGAPPTALETPAPPHGRHAGPWLMWRLQATAVAVWKVLALWLTRFDLGYRKLPAAHTRLGRHVAKQSWASDKWQRQRTDINRKEESRDQLLDELTATRRSRGIRRIARRITLSAQYWALDQTLRRMQRDLGQAAFDHLAAETASPHSVPPSLVSNVRSLRQQMQEVTQQLATIAEAPGVWQPQRLALGILLLSLCGCLVMAGGVVQRLRHSPPGASMAGAAASAGNPHSPSNQSGVGAAPPQVAGPWDAYSQIPKRERSRLHALQREWLELANRSFEAIRVFNAEGTNKLTRDRLKRAAYAKQDRECQLLKARIRDAGIDNWRMVLTEEGLMFAPGTVAYPVGFNMFEHHEFYSLACFIAEAGSVDIFTTQLAHVSSLSQLNARAVDTLSKVREGESVYVSLPPRSFSIEQFTGMEAMHLAMMDEGGGSEASNYINKIAMCVYPEGVPYVQCYTTHVLKIDDISRLEITLKPRTND